MREINSIEISRLVKELEDKLSGSRLRKFYDLGNDSFRFLFYKSNQNISIYCKLLKTFNETEFSEPAENATGFAMGIRKRILNSMLKRIEQYKSDRIIILDFENYRLIIEMFGKGNMILINNENKIELCYKIMRFKERTIANGEIYNLPSSSSFDQLADEETIESILNDAQKEKIITYLSKFLNIGPLYLEDIIKRAGLDPKKPLDSHSKGKLKNEILRFFKSLSKCQPRIFKYEGKMVDYSIIDILKYEKNENIEFENLNKLLDELYISERSLGEDKEALESLEKIKSNIQKQKELTVLMNTEAIEYKNAGNKIFENMQIVNQLINYARERKRVTLEELRNAFKNLKIKEVNLKDKRIKIEI